ncbi:20227_t:CDS:2 [Funneliformis geosporum]|nr:20227_t:CDS:2 [Funneliformis geosporum]
MCKKHRIGSTTYQKIIDNQRPPEPTEEWRRIIESVSISDQISENNQESSHNTPSSTIIQEDEITHSEYYKVANSFKDDTSRRKSDLKKLLNISREAVIHPIYSP